MQVKKTRNYVPFLIFLGLILFLVPGTLHAQSELVEIRDYRAAVSLLREGKLDLARAQYRSFLADYSNSTRRPRAYFGLAETYYLQQKYDSGVVYYRKALAEELTGEYREKAFRRGLTSARQSDRLREAEQIVELAGDSPARVIPHEGIRDTVKLFATRNEKKRALELVDAVLEMEPDSSVWLHEKAVLLAGLKRFDAAKSIITKLIEQKSAYETEARFLRAEIQSSLGNLAEARTDYNQLLDVPDFKPDALYGLAWVEINSKGYEKATSYLARLHEKNTRTPERLRLLAARDLARLHARQGNERKTKNWYDTAVGMAEDPRKSELLVEQAEFFVDRGKLKAAVPYYERAGVSLPKKSKKSLVEGYLARREYRKAVQELEAALESGLIEGHGWQRRLAYAYFRLQKFTKALDNIPSIKTAHSQAEEVKTLRLLGSIHYRLGKLDRAAEIFENWKRKQDGAEPELYLALVRDKLGNTDQALERLREILAGNPSQGLAARAHYHLARILFPSELEEVEAQLEAVEPGQLEQPVKIEFELLSFAFRLKREGKTEKTLKLAREIRNKIEREVYLGRWHGTLLEETVPRSWWTDLLLPELRESNALVREWGARTIRHLCARGWPKLALRTAREISPTNYKTKPNRRLRLAHLEALLANDKLTQLTDKLPNPDQLESWTGRNVHDLISLTTRVYRQMNRPNAGYEKLKKLGAGLPELSRENKIFLRESRGALALGSGRHGKARELLGGIVPEDRSLTGELNLAICEYHAGESDSSYRRLVELYTEWDSPPREFYDYGFRLLRSREESEKLKEWSRDFFSALDFPDTRSAEPLVANVRYWANQAAGTTAFEFINQLEEKFEAPDFLARLEYYRGVAAYNLGRLETAKQTFEQLREQYSPPQKLLVRVLRSEVELAVRLENWPLAYNRWRQLHELGKGGGTGKRLVNELGLQQVPEKFAEFITTMEKNYPEFLAAGDTVYWHGRIAEKRVQDTKAIERYEQYLESGSEKRRQSVRWRLAKLYEQRGLNQKALVQWRKITGQTDGAESLVRRAVLNRKLGKVKKSTNLFQQARGELSGRRHWIDYQLGRNQARGARVSEGLARIEAALSDAAATVPWLTKARSVATRLALNDNNTDSASKFLSVLDTSPRIYLYRAELNRQRSRLTAAQASLYEFKNLADSRTEGLREVYREIGASVYSQSDSYSELLELLPRQPENPEHQLLKLRALVELDRLSSAATFYQQLSSEVVTRGAELLADAYFESEEWRYARGFYEKSGQSPRVFFRLCETELELENYRKTIPRLEKLLGYLSDTEATDWRKPVFSLVQRLDEQSELQAPMVELLEAHWQFFQPLAGPAGRLGGSMALRADLPEKLDFFIKRIPARKVSRALLERVAEYYNEREQWTLLEQLLGRTKSNSDQYPHLHGYYSLLVRIQKAEQPPEKFKEKLNELLNEAIQAESPYAPRIQELLGDLYFKRENYEKAAVEYNKVRILFESPPNLQRTRYKLGLSHVRLENSERAKNIFEELVGDTTVEQQLRQKIRQRLQEQ